MSFLIKIDFPFEMMMMIHGENILISLFGTIKSVALMENWYIHTLLVGIQHDAILMAGKLAIIHTHTHTHFTLNPAFSLLGIYPKDRLSIT